LTRLLSIRLSAIQNKATLGFEGTGDDTLPDDFDDYNGTPGGDGKTWSEELRSGTCMVRTMVCYVNLDDLQGIATNSTWYKRVDVCVWSTIDPNDTVKMSAIYSYGYFRAVRSIYLR
jgi:hypothetical protein